jgi:cell wall-associated NlpC family hydrolase
VAIRFARRVRPLLVVAALGSAAVLAPSLASATPAAPHQKPTIASVQKQLGELALKNSQVVEKFDHARVVVAKREKAAHAAGRTAAQANATYSQAKTDFTRIIQAQYESGGFGAAGALLDSKSGNNYLDRLDTLQLISSHDADVVSLVTHAKETATAQSKKAQSLLASAKKERDGLSQKRNDVEKQIKKYQDLLSTLNSAQQAAYQRAANPTVSDTKVSSLKANLPGAGSKAARAAVQFALDQVGKPYVFGAAGPSSYDCSGLTMMAWQQGGVSLPHSAADQYNYGTHVSSGSLLPGDLVFFYQPIGHVAIYIGHGLMVSAPTEGQDVTVVPLDSFSSDYTGATRLS